MDGITMTTETVLPLGWEINFLKQLCTIKTGDKDVNQGNENGKYPFFTCAQEVSKSDTFSFKGEAILIAGNGNFNVKFYNGEFEAYQRTYVLQNFESADAKYLFYFIENKLSDITKGNRGSTIKYIRLGDIANYPIFYPTDKKTQTAIVNKIESLFADIDAGIASLKKAQTQLKQYRQSLLKNAFNGELTKDWREQNAEQLPSESELLTQIQAAREAHHKKQLTDWQNAVKEWEQAGKIGKKPSKPKAQTQAIKFDENFVKNAHYVRISVGAFIEPPKYGTSQKCEYEKTEKSTGVIRIPNITENGSINLDDMKYAEFSTDERNDYSLKNGDLLLIRSNGSVSIVGSVGLVGKKETDYIYAGYLIRLRPIQSIVNPKFLAFAFQGLDLRTQIEFKAKSTSGVNNINAQEVQDLQVNIFSLAEQTQIVAILEQKLTACDTLATELANQLKQAELLKQSVLKAAFSGRLKIDKRGDKQC